MYDKSNDITKDKIFRLLIALPIGIFFIWFLFRGIAHISYYIYYKPIYAIFGNSLYLPFYLYILKRLPLIFFFFVISIITKGWFKLIPIMIMIFLMGISYFHVIKDIAFIHKEKYAVGEYDVNTLRASRGKKGIYHYVMSKPNDIYSIVNMDIYQYKELALLKDSDNKHGLKKKMIVVYYLPDTNIMLKYEKIF